MSDHCLHPIIIHKRKKTRSQLRRLKKGRGKLVDKVEQIVSRAHAAVNDENKILVPIVVHYTLKGKVAAAVGSLLGN